MLAELSGDGLDHGVLCDKTVGQRTAFLRGIGASAGMGDIVPGEPAAGELGDARHRAEQPVRAGGDQRADLKLRAARQTSVS